MLTRKDMLKVIAGGERISLAGTSYGPDNINDLPSEADLAKGDAKREEETIASLKAQKEALDAELKKLESSKAESEAKAKSDAKAEAKETEKSEAKSDAKSEAKSDAKK